MGRYKPRPMICEDCGDTVIKVPRWDRAILCLECGLRRSESSALQMAAKRGPAWDAWLASNADGAASRRPNQESE